MIKTSTLFKTEKLFHQLDDITQNQNISYSYSAVYTIHANNAKPALAMAYAYDLILPGSSRETFEPTRLHKGQEYLFSIILTKFLNKIKSNRDINNRMQHEADVGAKVSEVLYRPQLPNTSLVLHLSRKFHLLLNFSLQLFMFSLFH